MCLLKQMDMPQFSKCFILTYDQTSHNDIMRLKFLTRVRKRAEGFVIFKRYLWLKDKINQI